jgi:hypothetical protein
MLNLTPTCPCFALSEYLTMIEIRIVRAVSTGKYHRSYVGANITSCNASGQRRIPRIATATERELERAGTEAFCRKCFPNGPPGRSA